MTQEIMGNENDKSKLITAEQYHSDLSKIPLLKSGDRYLDTLLDGGFRKGLVHLLIGSRKRSDDILMKAAVIALKPRMSGGLGVNKIAYIDGDNHFSPYLISKIALSMKMDPNDVLSRINVARAFNWSQMVEITEVKLSKMQDIGLILIAGLTSMFEVSTAEHRITEEEQGTISSSNNGSFHKKKPITPIKVTSMSQKPFDDLKSAINGIKKAIEANEPIVLITARKNEQSRHKPVGGKYLTHFSCVIVDIVERDRYTDYILVRHPFLPPKRVVKWNQISDKLFGQLIEIDDAEFPEQKFSEQKVPNQKFPEQDLASEKGLYDELEGILQDTTEERHEACKETVRERNLTQPPNKNGWNTTIQHPNASAWIWKTRNLQLREKRKRANLKSDGDRTQGLTLDFYLKVKSIK